MSPRFIDGALEEGGPNAGAGDAFGEVANEHLDHRLGRRRVDGGPPVLKEERHPVVGVDTGGDDDIDVDLVVDALDARDVATQTNHGRVHDGVDAQPFQRTKPPDGIGDAVVLASPLGRVVLLHLRREHEHVLMHQRRTERRRVNRAIYDLDLGHPRAFHWTARSTSDEPTVRRAAQTWPRPSDPSRRLSLSASPKP